jgi:hypothetical protein
MAPRTARDLLYKFTEDNIQRFEQLNTKLIPRILDKSKGPEQATLDVDATFIECEKKEAQYSYHRKTGYYPMLGFFAEYGLITQGEFRQGNESPGSKALNFLKKCLATIPDSIGKIRLRSDSAWYLSEIFDFCDANNIEFAIGGRRTNALMQTIEIIKDDLWQPWCNDEETLMNCPELEKWELAETTYSLDNSDKQYRVVVIRKPFKQFDIFRGIYNYDIVVSNMNWEKKRLMNWYFERCNSENWIKELKYGLSLNQFPCSKFLPNAAFFHINLLAFNLIQALKLIKLDLTYRFYTVKSIRYHFIKVAGILAKHARKLFLNIFHKYPYFDLFEKIMCPT